MVVMEAAASTDDSGVEYRFVCTAGGGHDSGWQNFALYVDMNLSPGIYTYQCQTRDRSPLHNQTAWSAEASVTIE
jgi:hypothetical protein